MKIRPATRIGWLLSCHPELLSVFRWWEAVPNQEEEELRLRDFCERHGLNLGDLLVELSETMKAAPSGRESLADRGTDPAAPLATGQCPERRLRCASTGSATSAS